MHLLQQRFKKEVIGQNAFSGQEHFKSVIDGDGMSKLGYTSLTFVDAEVKSDRSQLLSMRSQYRLHAIIVLSLEDIFACLLGNWMDLVEE